MNLLSKSIAQLLFTFLVFGIYTPVHAQNSTKFSTKIIEDLINSDAITKAEIELKRQTEFYLNAKQYDSLSNLVYYHGAIARKKNDTNFLARSEHALERLKDLTSNPDLLYNAYSDMASLTVETDMNSESYKYNKLGLEVAKKTTEDRLNKMSKRTYGLASTSYFMRKFDLVKKHGIEAFKINERNPNASAANIFSACNILGVMMQNENKLDSALFYYEKGVKALENTEGNLSERFYYPAILTGNIAIIYMNQGKINQSLKNQQDAITNYRVFIDSSANHPSINNIRYNYLSTINDMGSNYVKLGEVERALNLFEYNYNQANKHFDKNSIQQLVYTNQFAQGKWVAHEYEKALELINEAYEKFKILSDDYARYMTYGVGTKANILENLGRNQEARAAYKLSDSLYEMVNPGNYSFDRLTKLREASLFYSRNGYPEDAMQAASTVLKVAKDTKADNNLATINAYTLMAGMNLNLKNYNESISWAEKSLDNIKTNTYNDRLNNIFWQKQQIEPEFIKTKATYYLSDTTKVDVLSKVNNQLQKTLDNFNNNISFYSSDFDKNEYLYNAISLLNFNKRVLVQLYKLTNNSKYLDQIISINESQTYNRIRSKLGNRQDIAFYNIPTSITEREIQLKTELSELRPTTISNQQNTKSFETANNEWHHFMDSLKTNYPKYYKMRYETIRASLGDIRSKVSDDTSVIRYFFIDEDLYAFTSNKNENKLHKLNHNNLTELITQLTESSFEDDKIFNALNMLYKQLWQPLESSITTSNVIIIPDHELFNLSFESLTTIKVNSYNELVTHGLISKHVISYNYSLYLLDQTSKVVNYDKDFIAFAPEFNDVMKENYKVAIKDSLNLDKTYLKLLPQPFTIDLAEEYSRIFDGNFFVNENASKQLFTEEAKEHKIIHIGTHAESNNISPELSRLIFAKNLEDASITEDNSLYTYEIYNQNLFSNLAILTACETGKPTYQPGEGMISLAHAFNYAGSESILTSLWKIDEQSSANIIENFYGYLKNGLAKDKALQKAKLDYLATAKGRTLAPQYWAGLVLIGNTSPINIETSNQYWLWIVSGILLIGVVFILMRRKQPK